MIENNFGDTDNGNGKYHPRNTPDKLTRYDTDNGKNGIDANLTSYHHGFEHIGLDELHQRISDQDTYHHIHAAALCQGHHDSEGISNKVAHKGHNLQQPAKH